MTSLRERALARVRGASPGRRHAADSASIRAAISGRSQSPEASAPQTIRLLVSPDAGQQQHTGAEGSQASVQAPSAEPGIRVVSRRSPPPRTDAVATDPARQEAIRSVDALTSVHLPGWPDLIKGLRIRPKAEALSATTKKMEEERERERTARIAKGHRPATEDTTADGRCNPHSQRGRSPALKAAKALHESSLNEKERTQVDAGRVRISIAATGSSDDERSPDLPLCAEELTNTKSPPHKLVTSRAALHEATRSVTPHRDKDIFHTPPEGNTPSPLAKKERREQLLDHNQGSSGVTPAARADGTRAGRCAAPLQRDEQGKNGVLAAQREGSAAKSRVDAGFAHGHVEGVSSVENDASVSISSGASPVCLPGPRLYKDAREQSPQEKTEHQRQQQEDGWVEQKQAALVCSRAQDLLALQDVPGYCHQHLVVTALLACLQNPVLTLLESQPWRSQTLPKALRVPRRRVRINPAMPQHSVRDWRKSMACSTRSYAPAVR